MAGGVGQRILVAELDSTSVGRLYANAASRSDADETLIGAIRIAHLLGEDLLLTDAMLLDSAFFTRNSPADVAGFLGWSAHRLPITVLVSGNDLQDSLEVKLEVGSGFRWQLQEAGGLGFPTIEIQQGWQRWIDAADDGRINLEPMLRRLDGTNKPPLTVEPDFAFHLSGTADAALRSLAGLKTSRRSDFWDACDRALSHASDETRVLIERMRALWNTAYLDAMARQQDASWISVSGSVSPSASGRRTFGVSGQLVETMTKAPPAVYAYALFACRAERTSFHRSATKKNLGALSFKAESSTEIPGRREVIRRAVIALTLAATVALLTSPLVDPTKAPRVWAGVLLVVIAAATVPWGEVRTLWHVSARRLDGVLSVTES